jgi:hypothetical protein
MFSPQELLLYAKGWFRTYAVDDIMSHAEVIANDIRFHLFSSEQRSTGKVVGTLELMVLDDIARITLDMLTGEPDNIRLGMSRIHEFYAPALKKIQVESLGLSPEDYDCVQDCHSQTLRALGYDWHALENPQGRRGVDFLDMVIFVTLQHMPVISVYKLSYDDTIDWVFNSFFEQGHEYKRESDILH